MSKQAHQKSEAFPHLTEEQLWAGDSALRLRSLQVRCADLTPVERRSFLEEGLERELKRLGGGNQLDALESLAQHFPDFRGSHSTAPEPQAPRSAEELLVEVLDRWDEISPALKESLTSRWAEKSGIPSGTEAGFRETDRALQDLLGLSNPPKPIAVARLLERLVKRLEPVDRCACDLLKDIGADGKLGALRPDSFIKSLRLQLEPYIADEDDLLMLSVEDLEDVKSLAQKLKESADEVSIFVEGFLKESTRSALDGWRVSDVPPAILQYGLVDDLNALLRGELIWQFERFKNVPLRPETKDLLQMGPTCGQIVRLNRMLLEDAYPEALLSEPLERQFSAWTALISSHVDALSEGRDRVESAGGEYVIALRKELAPEVIEGISEPQLVLGKSIHPSAWENYKKRFAKQLKSPDVWKRELKRAVRTSTQRIFNQRLRA